MPMTSTTINGATRRVVLSGDTWTELVASASGEQVVRWQLRAPAEVAFLRAASAPSTLDGFIVNDTQVYEDTMPAGDRLWAYVPSGRNVGLVVEVRNA